MSQLAMIERSNFLRFLKCSSFDTIVILLEVKVAQMLTSFKKILTHRLKTSQSSSRVTGQVPSSFIFISGKYYLISSTVKNFRSIATFTYFLPLFAFINLIVIKNNAFIF
jgi:hypothetical protein